MENKKLEMEIKLTQSISNRKGHLGPSVTISDVANELPSLNNVNYSQGSLSCKNNFNNGNNNDNQCIHETSRSCK